MADNTTKRMTPTQEMINRIMSDADSGGVKTIEKEEKKAGDNVPVDGDGNPIVVEEKKPTEEIKPKPTEPDYSYFKDLTKDEIAEFDKLELDTELRYKFIEARNDVKKNQRLVSERQKQIDDIKTKYADSKINDYEAFVNEMRQDARGGWTKYQDKLNLPDIGFLEKQFGEGNSIEDRLAQYQETQLVPDIESKFKLEAGTFVYDPADAHKAKTPSFSYRAATEAKEQEFRSEYAKDSVKIEERLRDALEHRKLDIIKLKEDYFPSFGIKDDMSDEDKNKIKQINEQADGEFTTLLSSIDEMFTKIREGEISQEKNPMSLNNIFRGVHFDYLVDRIKKEMAEDIHKQYREKGLFLRDMEGKPLPTVVDKMKGNSEIETPDYLSEEKKKRSPLLRSVSRTLGKVSSNQ